MHWPVMCGGIPGLDPDRGLQELRLRTLGDDAQPADEPRHDEQTRRLMEERLNLTGATALTCTVYEERPLRLGLNEVGNTCINTPAHCDPGVVSPLLWLTAQSVSWSPTNVTCSATTV